MKACVLALCVAFALATAAGAASPGTGGWSFVMPGGPRGAAAAEVGALDSSDPEDVAAYLHGDWMAGAYHEQDVDGWDGETGFYAYDIRAPLLTGQTKSWTVYFWAVPGSQQTDRSLSFGEYFWPTGDPAVIPRLEYIQKPQGVTGGPEVGTVWTEPNMWIPLPFYSTSDGLTGHGFRFTLTMVPEPASLGGLAAALAGFGAAGMRRRR